MLTNQRLADYESIVIVYWATCKEKYNMFFGTKVLDKHVCLSSNTINVSGDEAFK